MHRDEFLLHYGLIPTSGFPAVFGVDNEGLTQVLTSEEIDSTKTCKELISLISPLIDTRTT